MSAATGVLVATPGRRVGVDFAALLAAIAAAAPVPARPFAAMAAHYSIAARRNQLAKALMASPDFSHILMVDEDGRPPENIISQLLALEAPIASPVTYGRAFWLPNFGRIDESGREFLCSVDGTVQRASWCGGACVLIDRAVFEAMEEPWFEGFDATTGGREDARFCMKAADLGFETLVDTSIVVPHRAEIWVDEHNVDDLRRCLPVPRLPGESREEYLARLRPAAGETDGLWDLLAERVQALRAPPPDLRLRSSA